ncbi:nucleocapsid protein [Gerbil paramyxovirus]|uniref:Nucleocapsid n=1 Tax=Gerbil paramyxovirus TaxID=2942127 RepID=A0A977NV71_9MONO|nr:nucleocapsid protein [Gerbil paramyxovirus]
MTNKDLGVTSPTFRVGISYSKMGDLNNVLSEFRSFKNNPPKRGALSSALQGFKRNVIVLVPVMKDSMQRFHFMTMCLRLAWSVRSSAAFITGSFLSLLSLFAENPGAMLRSLLRDPDVEVQIAEVAEVSNTEVKLVARGRDMEKFEQEIIRMAEGGPSQGSSGHPFVISDYGSIIPRSTEDLQLAIQTVTAQIWILLTKAVTASDTARESEARRWVKYEQQRRADADYKLNDNWLAYARARIASDLTVRRYMVEILIDANKAAPPKARILELICDIGNYVSEAGLAGFFLTIKYGIETKYPALALNELQADLATVLSLMKCYVNLGERAPYMVILEDSIQTRFSPGSYPLLWSYAMGVGTMLDRAVNNLNYSRNYLEHSFYNLGVGMVEKMEGSVNRKVADELGLTPDQINQIKDLMRQETDQTSGGPKGGPRSGQQTSKFVPDQADDIVPSDDTSYDIDPEFQSRSSRSILESDLKQLDLERSKNPYTPLREKINESEFADKGKPARNSDKAKTQLTEILKNKKNRQKKDLTQPSTSDDKLIISSAADQSNDLAVINN